MMSERTQGDGPKQELNLCSRLALRPKEAAQALGMSERTLRTVLPELPHVRVGGVVLLPVDLLREWLREHVQAGRDETRKIVDEVLRDLHPR